MPARVSAAALLSGFNDAAYFSREFRKVVGVAPNRYLVEERGTET